MSKGPGQIEQRISELFAETRDRALSVEDICDRAFELNGRTASRAQRLSATRAAHRLVRRLKEIDERVHQHRSAAHKAVPEPDDLPRDYSDAAFAQRRDYYDRLYATRDWQEADRLSKWLAYISGLFVRTERHPSKKGWLIGDRDFWAATTTPDKRLWFHLPDVPVQVWAVSIQPAGVIWADAEIVKITERNVVVRYAGELARLDREKLWRWWANWRGVMFVSSRTGRIAARLDKMWQERYGYTAGTSAPPVMQMPLADAIALLGVALDYTYDDVIAAFRREAKKAHPDLGGTAEQFRQLVEARDRLLAALGTSAPAPKMPTYAPKGVQVVYRVASRRDRQLGSRSTRLLTG
jgi:hypothetical protein